MEGPSKGSSEQGGPEHIFLAAPSLLFLLLFKLVAISIGVSGASVVAGTAFTFFLLEALVAGRIGCSVMLAGMGAVTDVGMNTGVETGSAFLVGEAVAGLSSIFFGDFFFFYRSLRSSLPRFFGVGPDPTPFLWFRFRC